MELRNENRKGVVSMQDKVSIVTVTYNAEKALEITLDSVCSQSYFNKEYIIKDGESTDNTDGLVQQYIEKHPKLAIKYITARDSGIYDAMNQAVRNCTGKWIIFINSGDAFYANNTLKSIFQNKDYNNYGVIYGNVLTRDSSGDAVWIGDINKISKKMPFSHQACFVRKKNLIQYPFMEDFKIAADYNQIFDIYKAGIQFYKVNETIAIFLLNGISSTKYLLCLKEQNRVIRIHGCRSKVWFFKYLLQIFEVWIKILIAKLPLDKQKIFRIIYKKYRKGYYIRVQKNRKIN